MDSQMLPQTGTAETLQRSLHSIVISYSLINQKYFMSWIIKCCHELARRRHSSWWWAGSNSHIHQSFFKIIHDDHSISVVEISIKRQWSHHQWAVSHSEYHYLQTLSTKKVNTPGRYIVILTIIFMRAYDIFIFM